MKHRTLAPSPSPAGSHALAEDPIPLAPAQREAGGQRRRATARAGSAAAAAQVSAQVSALTSVIGQLNALAVARWRPPALSGWAEARATLPRASAQAALRARRSLGLAALRASGLDPRDRFFALA